MGFTELVKGLFKRDRDVQAAAIAKGTAIATNVSVDSMDPSSGTEGVNALQSQLAIEQDLISRYIDYENMDDYVETSAALTVFADDSTIPDTLHRKTVWATSEDRLVRDLLNDMLHRMIRIEEDAWVTVRSLAKYGNLYGEVLTTKGGVIGINWLPAPSIRRIINSKGVLLGFIQDVSGQFNYDAGALVEALEAGKKPIPENENNSGITFFYPWEMVHWRLRSKRLRSPYGYGVLDSSRWIWKRLQLMEDTALVQKLTRAPGRYAFYVDTGDLPPKEAVALVRKVKSGFKKKRLIDPSTGQLDLRNNPLCLAGDTEVPLLDGSKKTIVEMAEAFDRGEEQWVYGVDRKNNSKMVPGKVVWAGQTRKDAELVRVTLDNGESFRVTPDHKCILRSGDLKDAQDLVPGESLMPLRRTISSFEKGDTMDGYEKVYDPSSKKYVYTHRMVVRELGMKEKGKLTHHNAGKLNNNPSCLESMTWREHSEHHCKLGQMGGAKLRELRKTDKALDQKLRDAASRTLKERHADPEWKKRNAEAVRRSNIERDSGRYIRAYNDSDKHVEDNAQRSSAMKAFWTDDARSEYSETRTISYSDVFISALEEFVRSNPGSSADDVADFVSSDSVALGLLNEGSCRVIKKAHRHLLLKAYRAHGYSNFSEFKESACSYNHKVVSVERLSEREDTYTLTVDSCHNFGLSSGVVVCNSPSEDFWIPTRGGKDSTRIEVISGPDVQMMDDVEYFQGKLVTSTTVPRRFMGLGDPGDSTNMMASQDDVRFARACMRLQREYVQGLEKVARIHLAALNIDPDSVPWQIKMTVPSAIFEMQQIEVMNAQAGLASSLSDYMSKPWILQRVFNFTRDDAQAMIQAKRDEESGDVVREAEAQAKVMKLFPELEGALDDKDGGGKEESVSPKKAPIAENEDRRLLRSLSKKANAIERSVTRINKMSRINGSGKRS